ncbi:hypothetical protein A1D31_35645 [Bradyrhizobium liaoningense]|nr:hypothetical protein A1D31_35645 [Bradyrhizobium liaoningense]
MKASSAWPIAAQTASTVRGAALRSRCLSLAKTCSIGFRSGEYFGRKKSLAPTADELANCLAPVAAEVIQDDDIAGWKDGQKHLLDIGAKAHAVDRPLDEPWRIDPVMAQSRQEGHGLPPAVGNLRVKSVAARRPSPQWRHIGPRPSLVDEDQPLSLDAILILCPLGSPPRDLGAIAFASRHAFF